ncbi:MAG: STAS domain-containing protein [SAR324 cluster bacterium]|nr:STAS domain-containing protein [SAR324 cluster bacterium]
MEISHRFKNNILILSLSGDIDEDEVGSIIKKVSAFAEKARGIVVDLKDIRHLDSIGIGIMALMYGEAEKLRKKLIICNSSEIVFETLILSGIDKLISICSTLEEALDDFKQASVKRGLQITHRIENDVHIVSIGGELVQETTNEFRGYLDTFLDNEHFKGIILNLKNTSQVNSAGLGNIIAAQKKLQKTNKHLNICCLNKNISRIFSIGLLTEVISIYPDEAEALSSFED